MTDTEMTKAVALASAVFTVLVGLFIAGGLMTVIVAATLFDCALRRFETLRERRLAVPTSADRDLRERM